MVYVTYDNWKEEDFRKIYLFFTLFLFLIFITLPAGCRNKESYKKEIELKGITYSEKSFLNEIIVGNTEIIELFIKAGIDINAKNENGDTALMIALLRDNLEIARMLTEQGADVNAQDKDGYTALMFASFNGYHDIAKILIKKGADVHVENKNGYTALMFASLKGHHETAELLKKAAAK